MKILLWVIVAVQIVVTTASYAEDTKASDMTNEETQESASPAPVEAKPPEEIDISDLEEDYWRPNKDELEVVQNRRFEKAKHLEFSLLYGIYQGKNYVNSKAAGVAATYNITNEFFVDASYLKISNEDNDLLNSVKKQYNFTPDFNREDSQTSLHLGWTPIYAKFSLLGKEISHFEMYIAPGIGLTKTASSRLSGHLTIGQKFFITEHIILRIDWRMSRYKDRITTTQGATSVANGGPGYVEQTEKTDNIIFGIGWMF